MSGTAEVGESSAVLTTYGGALAEAAATAHAGPREQMGEQLIRTFLTFYEDPQRGPQLLEVFRSAATGGAGADQMRGFMSTQLFAQAGGMIEKPPANIIEAAEILGVPPLHLNAAVAQVMGVVMVRYILKVEPMASASPDELVGVLAPTIQRYLVG